MEIKAEKLDELIQMLHAEVTIAKEAGREGPNADFIKGMEYLADFADALTSGLRKAQ